MTQYDVYGGAITKLANPQAIIDIGSIIYVDENNNRIQALKADEVGYIIFRVINTGDVGLDLVLDMWDLDTGIRLNYAYNCPWLGVAPGAWVSSHVQFTMPNHNLRFELRLHD